MSKTRKRSTPARGTGSTSVAAKPAAPSAPPPPNDTTLRWAVRVLYVEAGLTTLLALLALWAAATKSNVSLQSAAGTAGFAILCALIFGGLGLALSRRKSLARGPAIVLELLLVPLAWSMISAGLLIVGIPALLIGVLGAGLLLAPPTRAALYLS